MVCFSNYAAADEARNTIRKLSEKINLKEFKFSKTCDAYKKIFFENSLSIDFYIYLLIIDKAGFNSTSTKLDKFHFYKQWMVQLIKSNKNIFQKEAAIYIDGSGDKAFKKALAHSLKKEIGNHKIKTIRFIDSKQEPLIQLADMVCGAAHRSSRQDNRFNKKWLEMIKHKIQHIEIVKTPPP